VKLRELMTAAVLTGLLCVGLSAQSNRQPSYQPPAKSIFTFDNYSGDQLDYQIGPAQSRVSAGFNCWPGAPKRGLSWVSVNAVTTCGPTTTGTWNTTNATVWWDLANWGYLLQLESWVTTLDQPGDAAWVYGYASCGASGAITLGYLPFNGIC
jgi:hypothetical protein